jgi:hypothetical protein
MARPVPHFLGGPLVYWELVRTARRPWFHLLRVAWAGLVCVQFLVFARQFDAEREAAQEHTDEWAAQVRARHGDLADRNRWAWQMILDCRPITDSAMSWRWGGVVVPGTPTVERVQLEIGVRERFARHYLAFFLQQQLIVLLLLTPALACGTLSHEKERGTLQALFGTQLRAPAIVCGKFLGRVLLIAQLAIIAAPAPVLLTIMADLGLDRLAIAGAVTGLLILAFAAASMLASVLTRSARDATLGCYAMIAIGILASIVVFVGENPLPVYLDPLEIMRQLAEPLGFPIHSLVVPLLVWASTAAACLLLAMGLLRFLWIRQMDNRAPRWTWAFRPAVGTAPIRWREQHVIGLAPLPWLRAIPRWLGMLVVFAFSVNLAGWALDDVSGRLLRSCLPSGDVATVIQNLRRVPVNVNRLQTEVVAMGGVLVVLGVLVIGVRSLASIPEERRRRTWEDLTLTPFTLRDIARQKLQGILLAAPPYLAMYLLPMFALSSIGGWPSFFTAVVCACVATVAMAVVAFICMWWSAARVENVEG